MMRVRLEFKLEDLWLGVFWKRTVSYWGLSDDGLDVWVCLVPCFPLHFIFRSRR